MPAPPEKVLIVGGGVFGSTTALGLIKGAYKGHEGLITILDRSATPPASDAASFDFNKIIRQEYSDEGYARLAHEAMELWRDPEWSANYHESGVVVSVRKDAVQSSYISRSLAVNSLPGMETPGKIAEVLPTRESVAKVYPSSVPLGDFASQNVYINYAGGWGWSLGATASTIERVRAAGVNIIGASVKSIIYSEDMTQVEGVVDESGKVYKADLTILCVGSWTPLLLPELASELLPTGQVVGTIQLTPEEHERYKGVRVTRLVDNGFYIFPPSADGIVKFAIHQKGYLNPKDGFPSVPRTTWTAGYEEQEIPADAREALHTGLSRIYPELAAKKQWRGTRLCWYSDRPSGDWLIDYHPNYNKTLFICAGCCGHAFKFMPIFDRIVPAALNGTLPKHHADIWAYHHRVPSRRDESRSFSEFKRLDAAEHRAQL